MNKNQLLQSLKKVEQLSNGSRFSRLINNPRKYIEAIKFKYVSFKKNKQPKAVSTTTFFKSKMHLYLPSSTDIYLTGGKSHFSEIKLARFLINNLDQANTFIDVGAHYGYFTLLAACLVGKKGKVFAFEASPSTFKILNKNKNTFNCIEIYNKAVSDKAGELTFFQFPNLFSEYNSIHIKQHKNEDWFTDNKPQKVTAETISLDQFLTGQEYHPKIIKIDVEGAEYEVIKGLKNYLSNFSPIIVIEFLSERLGNLAHKKAEELLNSLAYEAHYINNQGDIEVLKDTSSYFTANNIDSDNLVFIKNDK